MGGGGAEVVIILFDILSMIPLRTAQTEKPFFKKGVVGVPEGESEAETPLAISYAKQAILPPPISTASGMIMRKVFPGFTIVRVVFTDSSPLTLRQVWAPSFPVFLTPGVLGQTNFLCSQLSLFHNP